MHLHTLSQRELANQSRVCLRATTTPCCSARSPTPEARLAHASSRRSARTLGPSRRRKPHRHRSNLPPVLLLVLFLGEEEEEVDEGGRCWERGTKVPPRARVRTHSVSYVSTSSAEAKIVMVLSIENPEMASMNTWSGSAYVRPVTGSVIVFVDPSYPCQHVAWHFGQYSPSSGRRL